MPEFRALLASGGEMGERIRAFDWAATPLGHARDWPQSLRSALSICLNSSFPTAIYWGRDLRLFYNDAWAPIPGPRHPDALGRPAREVWPDIWHVIEPQFRSVLEGGKGFATLDQMLPMQRFGRLEETYWDYSFTPIAGEDGNAAGILNQGQETTDRVFAQRRNALLVELNDRLRQLDSTGEIIATATGLVGRSLGIGRVGYGEIDQMLDSIRIERCWTDDGMADIAGILKVGDFGDELHAALSMGEAFRVDDSDEDPRLTPEIRARYAAIDVRAGLVMPIIKHGHYVAALFAHDDEPHYWNAHHELLLRQVAERIWREVARVRAETALRDSEERHRLIFEQAHDIIFTADLDQVITSANPASAQALDTTAEALVGRSIGEFVSAEDFARTGEMLRRKLANGGTTQYEVDILSLTGRSLRWEVKSTLAIGGDGYATGLHAIARDVTERRAFEERQRLLINELNHRVKNTLALVQGLALQSFKGDRDPAEAQAAFGARLATLAAAHDLLTREKWEGATLAELVTDATRPYAEPAGRIIRGGPNVVLTPKAAVSLVLALHELATNAAKYGSLSTPEGTVEIDWRAGKDRLRLEWRERGGPAVTRPERRGFGLRMIERALANDLTGTVGMDFAPTGLVCTIDAPVPVRPHASAEAL